ncbi:MAG: dTDP-4-dehydrorhamnose reductase [Candidatus Gastranaerophilales bacterium]|nr:dTDP-4-dehydrorhamnose reductase [Candidatus Gastranaerophilales bacterium]
MKTIVLTGAKGMFGQDATRIFGESGYKVIPVDIQDFDITQESSVKEYFNNLQCDYVVHAAAYTQVDLAETNREKAFLINAKGAENLAKVTAEKGIPIVYISTDYVFDGEGNTPYLPSSKTNPQSVYGASKLEGEIAVQKYNPKHFITRTSWLYGKNGKNFVDTMIALSQTQPVLKVVNDQAGCPTWTYDLAEGILKIIGSNSPYGIYHVCGSGYTTWWGFARKIFELENINIEVIPVTTAEFPRPAKRPKYSVMENNGICRHWEQSLSMYLEMKRKVSE